MTNDFGIPSELVPIDILVQNLEFRPGAKIFIIQIKIPYIVTFSFTFEFKIKIPYIMTFPFTFQFKIKFRYIMTSVSAAVVIE